MSDQHRVFLGAGRGVQQGSARGVKFDKAAFQWPQSSKEHAFKPLVGHVVVPLAKASVKNLFSSLCFLLAGFGKLQFH